MNWKTIRTASVAVLTAVLIGLWLFWLRLGPSFAPDDVTLRGKLLPIASVPDAKAQNGETIAAEVSVKRDANASGGGQGDYLYVFVPGTRMTTVSAVEEPSTNVIRPAANQSGLSWQAQAMLHQIGESASLADLTESFWQYTGASNSYTARFLLKPEQGAAAMKPTAANASAYAIYIHEERKWGRNVSWTKAVKLETK